MHEDMILHIDQGNNQISEIPFIFTQKCVIEINETQTCAAVASGMISRGLLTMPKKKVNFHANRPFLYFIRNIREKVILFAGKYDGK